MLFFVFFKFCVKQLLDCAIRYTGVGWGVAKDRGESGVEGWMEGEMEVNGRREGKGETHIHYNKKRIIQRLMLSTLISQ